MWRDELAIGWDIIGYVDDDIDTAEGASIGAVIAEVEESRVLMV